MIRFARDFRLVPIVLLATIALFALKVSGLVFDGGYTLAQRLDNRNKSSLTIVAPESVPEYPKIIIADGRGDPGAPKNQQSWANQNESSARLKNLNRNDNADETGRDAAAGPEPARVAAPAAVTANRASIALRIIQPPSRQFARGSERCHVR